MFSRKLSQAITGFWIKGDLNTITAALVDLGSDSINLIGYDGGEEDGSQEIPGEFVTCLNPRAGRSNARSHCAF